MKNMYVRLLNNLLLFSLFFAVGFSTASAQWVQTSSTPAPNPRSIVFNGSNFYVGSYGGGVFVSTNGGTTFTKAATLANAGVWSVYLAGSNLLAGTDGGGIYLSTNNGAAWTNPLASKFIRAFASDPAGNIYAAGYPNGVWRSTDNGASWNILASPGTNLLSIAIYGSTMLVGNNSDGIYRSGDGGITWTHALIASTNVWSFATIGSTIFAAGTTGFFRSIDNGLTWTQVSTPGGGYQAEALVAIGSNLLIGTGIGAQLSTDNGSTWTPVNTGLTTAIVGLAADNLNAYAGSYYYFGPSGFWKRPLSEMLPGPPAAITTAATQLTNFTASLNGTVNAHGSSTTVTFDYGLTTSYGSSVTATPGTVTGSANVAVSAALTGLIPGTTYHFRVNAVNSIGTTLGSDMTFSTAPLPSTVSAYWPLNEIVSGSYADYTGINNATGSTTPVAGKVGGAQQFDGSTSKIIVPANTSFDFPANGNFSIEFWYSGTTAPASTQFIMRRYAASLFDWSVFITTDKKVRMQLSSGGLTTVVIGSVIVDGNWHHVVATRNGTSGVSNLYVDGNLQGSTTQLFTVNFSSPTSNLEIGNTLGVGYLNGILDEIAIHNIELSSANILIHYNNGLNGLSYFTPTAPAFTSIPVTTGMVGRLYSYNVSSSGYPAAAYSLTAPPTGMTIDPNTGLIQWTPAAAGTYNINVVASNGVSPNATQSYTVIVANALSLPAGLVAYWQLNETIPGNYSDLTGINNATGSTTPVVGKVNDAQQFNGTSSKIVAPANASLDFPAAGNFSVEFWYSGSTTPASTQYVIRRYISSQADWSIYISTDKKVRFQLNNGGLSTTVLGSIIVDGTWHHVVATRNGTTGASSLYVDGSLKGSTTQLFTVNFSSPTAKLEVGSTVGIGYLNGSLDEIAIHNIELSSADVLIHYNNGLSGLSYFSPTAPVISSAPVTTAMVGSAYSYTVTSSGYPVATYSLTAPPSGMTINSTTGLIQWTPAASGNYNITVVASNGVSPDASQSFTLAVSGVLSLPAGIVAYWQLNETASGNYADLTGVNNATGSTSPVAGKVDGAQQFNGISSKIVAPANASLDFPAAGNFSVEFWYSSSLTPSSTQYIMRRFISSQAEWSIFITTDKKVRFQLNNGGVNTVLVGSIIVDGTWHHVVATRNGTTGLSSLYVDGSLKGSTTQLFTTDFSSPTAKLEIGSTVGIGYLNGSLDEIAVFNVELAQPDIITQYNNGVNGLSYFSPTAPLITTSPLLTAITGNLYSYDVHAIGYPAPVYTLVTFPSGMTIDPNSGLIQWTASVAGNYPVIVQANNGVTPPDTQSFSITVLNIPPGLVNYWKLDETVSGTYADGAGGSTGTGTTIPVPGQVFGAQEFNGINNKIVVPASTTFDFPAAGNFSIDFWFNGVAATPYTEYIIRRYISSQSDWSIFITYDKKIRFQLNNGGVTTVVVGGSIVDGNWHYVAATRNGSTGVSNLYVDGTLVGSTTQLFTVDFSSPTAKLEIGSTVGIGYLKGSLDEIAINNIELSQATITTNYNNGLAGIPIAKRFAALNNSVFDKVSLAQENRNVILNWNTNKESSGIFEVQRTTAGIEEWVKIGSVDANGISSFNYRDASLPENGKFSYKIKYIGKDGGYAYSDVVDIETLPVNYSLEQNYPNPFNPATTVKYQLPFNSMVNLTVFNLLGQKVTEIVNGIQSAGTYRHVWNASGFASGIYFLKLNAQSQATGEKFSKIIKLMLVK